MMVGNVDTFFAGGSSCLERRWKVEGGWSPGGLQESSAVLNSWCGYPRNESGSGSGRGREEQDRKQRENVVSTLGLVWFLMVCYIVTTKKEREAGTFPKR